MTHYTVLLQGNSTSNNENFTGDFNLEGGQTTRDSGTSVFSYKTPWCQLQRLQFER
jgi:hypothetical protein